MAAIVFLGVAFNVGFWVGIRREVECGLDILAYDVRFADP